jgi:anti-anti-sigma factor
MLAIKCIRDAHYLLIEAEGRLDALGASGLEKGLQDSDAGGQRFIILDCHLISFLSSAGIRSLIQLSKSTRQREGDLFLVQPVDAVQQVLAMSGLLNQLNLCTSIANAERRISEIQDKTAGITDLNTDELKIKFKSLQGETPKAVVWSTTEVELPKLVALSELGIASGIGCLAENKQDAAKSMGAFIASPGFFYFIPDNTEIMPDYFIGNPNASQAVYVKEALAVPGSPAWQIEIEAKTPMHPEMLLDTISSHLAECLENMPDRFAFIMITSDNQLIQGVYASEDMLPQKIWQAVSLKFENSNPASGFSEYSGLNAFLNQIEILPLEVAQNDLAFQAARCWVFMPDSEISSEQTRSLIEYAEPTDTAEEWELIIREIYHDAGKVILKPLHGGFSAKTFEVTSLDKEGRRMLPTVLKLGKVAIVEREEKGYRDYVHKFILNNSTTIMGSHYFGAWGGMRYNFLGINGPETKLKWLTHVYKERPVNELVPLFDRIFKNILKPWYGQPKLETMRLWENHSPLEPFFPNIVADAERILGISADQQFIDCPYLNRPVLNPYWFLKHKWPGLMSESRLWYSSICHGDLNMQNILLDETDNIYIIDFSETHPRNVVSDFARLEPIFKIEMTQKGDEEGLRNKLVLEEALTRIEKLTDRPDYTDQGSDPQVQKAYEMVLKMREYARLSMIFEDDPIPYWLAVLEWTLPYVSYWSVPIESQWHATFSAGLILERISAKMKV